MASSPGITPDTSPSFTVVNYVYTITTSATTTTPTVNFLFTITANLFGQDGNPFLGSCAATVTEANSNIQGELANTITTGSGTFSIYVTAIGKWSVVTSCPASGSSPAIYSTLSITGLPEKLKISDISPIV